MVQYSRNSTQQKREVRKHKITNEERNLRAAKKEFKKVFPLFNNNVLYRLAKKAYQHSISITKKKCAV